MWLKFKTPQKKHYKIFNMNYHVLIKDNKLIEPALEIMVLFILRNLILQSRIRSHPVGARCLIFGWTLHLLPYFKCANSDDSGETARMRRLAWAITGCLCDKYQNLMCWLS